MLKFIKLIYHISIERTIILMLAEDPLAISLKSIKQVDIKTTVDVYDN